LQSDALPLGYVDVLVRAVGFEPAVSGLKVRCNSSFASRACLVRERGVEPRHDGAKTRRRPGWLLPIDWCRVRDSNSRSALRAARLRHAPIAAPATRLGAIDETRTHTPSPAPASRTGGSTDSPTIACLVGDERLERSRPRGQRVLSPPGLPIPPVTDEFSPAAIRTPIDGLTIRCLAIRRPGNVEPPGRFELPVDSFVGCRFSA
jgi:hypothetical protein